MKTILKDILTVENGIIAHQVNMQGVMGAGLALHIKRKYPKVYSEYRTRIYDGIQLGAMNWVDVSEPGSENTLIIANLHAQDQYGSGLQTSYKHLKESLRKLNDLALAMNLPAYIPHGLGCRHGGGDWAAVEKLIAQQCPDAIICKLPSITERRLIAAIETQDHAAFNDLVGAMTAKDAAVFAAQYTGTDFEYMLWSASREWGFEVEWAGQYLLPEGDRDADIDLPPAQCIDWITPLKYLPRWGY